MSNSRDVGKGSKPRPIPDWEQFSNNFDAIFKKKQTSKECVEEDKKNKDMFKDETK